MKDISNKDDRKFILKNLPELSSELYDFSSYINNLIKLNYSNDTDAIKLSKLQNMKYKDYKLNKNEANKILKVLKQFGGEGQIKKIINDTIVPEFPNIDKQVLNQLSIEPLPKSTFQPSAPLMINESPPPPYETIYNNSADYTNDDTIDFLRDMAHNGINLDDSGIKNIEKYDDDTEDLIEPGSITESLETDNGNFKYIDTEIDNRSDEEKEYDNLPDGNYTEPNPDNSQETTDIVEPNKCRNRGFFECLINDNLMQDYHKRLDWIYIILFVLASVPFIGLLPNVIIIFRALRDGRTFLAIITSLTTALSLLEGHIIDLGLAFKIIYFLDVFTVIKYAKEYAPSYLNFDEPENKGIIASLLEKYGKMLSGFILFSLLTATEFAKSISKSYKDDTVNETNNMNQYTNTESNDIQQNTNTDLTENQSNNDKNNTNDTNDTNDTELIENDSNNTENNKLKKSSSLNRPLTAEEYKNKSEELFEELETNNINHNKANEIEKKKQEDSMNKKKQEKEKKKQNKKI